MIIVSGHLRVAAADRDAYVADCRDVVRAARSTPGCVDFALSADSLEPDRVNVLERWSSADALEAFRGDGPGDELASRILAAHVVEQVVAP